MKSHKTLFLKKRRKALLWGVFIGLLLALGATGIFVYQQTDQIIYFFKGAEGWETFRQATCTRGRDKYVFGDLRPGKHDPRKTPVEMSCEASLKWPVTHHDTPNVRGVKIHYVRYVSDHVKNTTPIMLYVPGVGDNYILANRYIKMAQRLNLELVAMENTNHGTSGNENTGAAYGCREKDDVLAVLKALTEQAPQRPILLFGTSMGAMTVANAAQGMQTLTPPVKAVILENAPTRLGEMLSVYSRKLGLPAALIPPVMKLTQWRTGYDFEQCAPIKQVPHFDVPVMITQYQKDHMIPLYMPHQLFEALPKPFAHQLKIYPHGAHSAIWNGQPKVYEADIQNFWKSALAG